MAAVMSNNVGGRPQEEADLEKLELSDSDAEMGGDKGVICSTPVVATVASKDKSFACEICCFQYSSDRVLNSGTKDYPKWRCKPCHSASRWVDKGLQSKLVNIGEHKRLRWGNYTKHVLVFRIWSPGDPEQLKAVSRTNHHKDRFLIWIEFEQTEEFEIFQEHLKKIGLLNYRQFLGYHVTWECYSRQEAEDLWTNAIALPNAAERKNSKGELVVPVVFPSYVCEGRRNSERGIKRTRERLRADDSSGEEDLKAHIDKRMKMSKADALPASSPVHHGEKFDTLAAQAPVGKPLEPKSKSSGPVVQQLSEGNLAQHDAISLKSSSRSSKSKRTSPGEVPANLTLTKARTECKSAARRCRTALWKNKQSDATSIKALVGVLGAEHLEVQTLKPLELCDRLNEKITRLEDLAKCSEQWVGASYLEKFTEFRKEEGEIFALNEEISQALASLKNVRLKAVQDTATSSRKLCLKVRNFFKCRPLEKQGFPATLISWLGSSVMRITEDSDEVNVERSPAIQVVEEDVALDWGCALLWLKESTHAAPTSVRKAIDFEKLGIMPAISEMNTHFEEFPAASINMKKGASFKGQDSSAVAPWIPEVLQGFGVANTLTVAVPWVYGSRRFGCRVDPKDFLLPTCGGFLTGIQGQSLVIMVPVEKLHASGNTPSSFVSMLNGLSPSAAAAFMKSSSSHVVLGPLDVLWIPFGTICCIVGLGGSADALNYAFFLPCLVNRLIASKPFTKTVVTHVTEVLDVLKASKPWTKMEPILKVWFSQFCEY